MLGGSSSSTLRTVFRFTRQGERGGGELSKRYRWSSNCSRSNGARWRASTINSRMLRSNRKAYSARTPPILIGGMGPKVMQPLAAREADIWHFFMRGNQPEAARRINDNFDAICRRVGRDPTEVERAIFIRPPSGGAGEAKAQREQVQALADAGVQHFIVSLRAPYDREGLRTFAKEVMPAFR